LRTYAWWLVLCVVGLDYFSTLAYLPSIAVESAHELAPLAAVGVVAVTLLAAVPVYLYVVGRSADGQGAVGLLDRHVRGWFGKTLVLVLLGFVATDFVVTRTLSLADAAAHVAHDPVWDALTPHKHELQEALPAILKTKYFDLSNEQLILTLSLSILGFGFYAFLLRGFNRWFMRLAAAVVVLYLALNAAVIVGGFLYLSNNPQQVAQGLTEAHQQAPRFGLGGTLWEVSGPLALLVLLSFPQMALGLSGFELTMASCPLVRGRKGDDAGRPHGRVFNTRLMLLAAALVMCVFILGAVFVVTPLVPRDEAASHRALAYLAHDARLGPLFEGHWFGLAYDVSAVLILSLAGASATVAFRDLTPHFLSRFGMQLGWAHKVGVIQHLFNVVILVVTFYFKASVAEEQDAYASSVLVLLAGAAAAAVLDLGSRWRGSWFRLPVLAPFAVIFLVFLVMIGSLLLQGHLSGLAIALLFVLVVLATAFVSRWLRSTEPRFQGFAFADAESEQRWKEICQLEFQVLAPHRPGHDTLAQKEACLRTEHRLGPNVPIIFVEVELGDPSEFFHAPLLKVVRRDGREVIQVTRCASIAHTLASIALEFRRVGRPPELHFGWSNESPLAANLNFLFMGQGNIPWMVHELIRKAEPDPARQPRVVIG
jgi:hypothetical protein